MQNNLTSYLFDTQECHENLLPLSFTRPIANFRAGITTLREKWEAIRPAQYAFLPTEYLREKFGNVANPDEEAIFIAGNTIASPEFAHAVDSLKTGQAILDGDTIIAFRGSFNDLVNKNWQSADCNTLPERIVYTFDLFLKNPGLLKDDYFRITEGRESQAPSASNRIIGSPTDDNGRPLLFIEEGAKVEGAIINLTAGPIYIGKDAEVMEGSCLRGPLALCNNAKIRMGSKIYGGSTFGPYCKAGGEIDNSVMFGYSNKAHDGYLGNAVVGEWCNIGAGVNASNLKNDYSKIRVWNYHTHSFMRTDLQFCGPIIGDHTKIGVNCMLNTATVLGVAVNLHGAGFPRVFVPSFSEGSPAAGFSDVSIKKFCDIAARVLIRRNITLTEEDLRIYNKVYEVASRYKK